MVLKKTHPKLEALLIQLVFARASTASLPVLLKYRQMQCIVLFLRVLLNVTQVI